MLPQIVQRNIAESIQVPTLIFAFRTDIALRVFIQTADASSGRSTARHTAYDHNFYLAPSTIAAISDLGR